MVGWERRVETCSNMCGLDDHGLTVLFELSSQLLRRLDTCFDMGGQVSFDSTLVDRTSFSIVS